MMPISIANFSPLRTKNALTPSILIFGANFIASPLSRVVRGSRFALAFTVLQCSGGGRPASRRLLRRRRLGRRTLGCRGRGRLGLDCRDLVIVFDELESHVRF